MFYSRIVCVKRQKEIEKNLVLLYGKTAARETLFKIKKLSVNYKTRNNAHSRKVYASSCLITYANSIQGNNETPLKSLAGFIDNFKLDSIFELVHILPFYPWDTDRGFSVCDFYKVDQNNGNWQDIKKLSTFLPLMFDFVVNHASIDNPLIQKALIERHLSKNDSRYKKYAPYKDFVIAFFENDRPDNKVLSKLIRPRPTPVLTHYFVQETKGNLRANLGEFQDETGLKILGSGWVWTTFSRPKNPDGTESTRQVDLNFTNPDVLVEAMKIILFYYQKGALWVRLDAIGYIWKKLSSSSLHEKETHTIISVLSEFLRVTVPTLVTVSEVNEPQEKAIEYLGKKGSKEADLFYQFAHFPLAVYAMLTSDPKPYKKWIGTLPETKGRQFITALGSHDGMGLKPVRGFLNENQIDKLIKILIKKHNALPNYSSLPGGEKIVYEICSTPWNLVNPPGKYSGNAIALNRYLSVVAIGLLQKGTPAIYINGLLGATNYLPQKGLDENRTINREIFLKTKLFHELKNPKSHKGRVFQNVSKLLKLRKKLPWFGPGLPKPEVVTSNDKLLLILLRNKDGDDNLLSVTNFSHRPTRLGINPNLISNNVDVLKNAINGQDYRVKNNKTSIYLLPFQTIWLVAIHYGRIPVWLKREQGKLSD